MLCGDLGKRDLLEGGEGKSTVRTARRKKDARDRNSPFTSPTNFFMNRGPFHLELVSATKIDPCTKQWQHESH